MGKSLFVGHGNTEMRGGPAIFHALYNAWPQDKTIIFENSYIKTMIKTLQFAVRNKTDCLVLENEYLTEVVLAFIIKLMSRKAKIFGPAYHIPPKPPGGRLFFSSLTHYIDYKSGVWFMSILYSKIYTENSYMEKYLKSINRKVNVIVESPGIKEEFIYPYDRIINFERDIDFLYLTSFTVHKGVYDFLQMAYRLSMENKNIRFIMAGYSDTDTLQKISDFLREKKLSNVEIIPNISENEKYRLYARSRIYVLPSKEDGIPITFYEAWAHGNIIVAYNLNTFNDIKQYFIPVKIGDVDGLVKTSSAVLSNYNDYRDTYLNKDYNYALEHSYEKGISKLVDRLAPETGDRR
jgi:glycosyltransferase involved in cell wall biosynthesis